MIERRDVFGWIGLTVAILALALALLPGWVSPVSGSDAVGIDGGWVTWFGRHVFGFAGGTVPTPESAATTGVWRQRLATTAAVLGFVALVLGIVSFARHERARLTGCCVGVASGAIATQHPLAALVIMAFAVLTSAILARER
jgi:hypothetical protein